MPEQPDISTPSTFSTRAAAREAEGRPARRPARPRDVVVDTGQVLGREYVVDAPLVGGVDLEVA